MRWRATRNAIIQGRVGLAQAHPPTKPPAMRKQPSVGLGPATVHPTHSGVGPRHRNKVSTCPQDTRVRQPQHAQRRNTLLQSQYQVQQWGLRVKGDRLKKKSDTTERGHSKSFFTPSLVPHVCVTSLELVYTRRFLGLRFTAGRRSN